MIEDKNEIRSNTKTTELHESRDNVYTMLMSTFELMIDAMSSAKVTPRNDMTIIVSIQKIQNNLRELEVSLTNELPDISRYDGTAPSKNSEYILQQISPRIRMPKEEQLEGYKPVEFGKVVDEKNHVDDLTGLYPVILTYDKKMYYMDTVLTNVCDTVCVRLFNGDGYLVGYVAECLLTIDAATKSIDSSVRINDNDRVSIENIFGNKNNMFGDREKGSVGVQRKSTRQHGSIQQDPACKPTTELSEKADIKNFIPVTLTYDSKMYYLEPTVYPIAGIDSLRMFNDDGCLVGYAFEDYLYEEFTNSEKVWKPTYPVLTKAEFKDRLEHSGNIPDIQDIYASIVSYNVHAGIWYREYKMDQQQRFLKYGSLVIDYKLLEELEFDLFDYFSRPNAIRNMSNFEDRQWLRGELEAMGIEITYTEKNKK